MKCDEGYLCVKCGAEVEAILDSALYLRYLLGEVRLEELHLLPECHLGCHRELAQYIVDPDFAPVSCEGFFDKRLIDPDYVRNEESRVTAAWKRLQALPTSGRHLLEYPLDENSEVR
jgi:hypothetical protein